MSVIEKLSIRGIRSFSPNEEQTIHFASPLTLILGHNGAGKTTIIECLKYITTGDLPPNSQGAAFIFDPKILNDTETKARVKLRFRNQAGQRMVCSRAMSATVKKDKKMQQKTLEGVLTIVDENDQQHSVTKKCAELDREVPQLMGVSKAVLESVIFCHQDEALWPLSEPMVIKKKFDEIFSSNKYTKAVDAMKQLKKERMFVLKQFEQQLTFVTREHEAYERTCREIRQLTEDKEKKEAGLGDLKQRVKQGQLWTNENQRLLQERSNQESRLKILLTKTSGRVEFEGEFEGESMPIEANLSVEDLQQTLKNLTGEEIRFERSLGEIRGLLGKYGKQTNGELINELTQQRKNYLDLIREIERQKDEARIVLQLKQKREDLGRQLSLLKHVSKDDLQSIQKEISTLNAQLSNLKQKHSQLSADLKQFQKSPGDRKCCPSKSIDELKREILIGEFLESVGQKSNCCALCGQELKSPLKVSFDCGELRAEVSTLIKQALQKVADQIKVTQSDLSFKQRDFQQKSLDHNRSLHLKQDLDKTDAELNQKSAMENQNFPGDTREIQGKINQIEQELKIVKNALPVETIEESLQSIHVKREELNRKLQIKLSTNQQELQREIKEVKEALVVVNSQLEAHQRLNSQEKVKAETTQLIRDETILQQLRQQINKLQSQINPKAKEKLKEAIVQLGVEKQSIKDLELFIKSIDAAIVKYHQMKIQQLNQIIDELWRMSYRGQDIDSIRVDSQLTDTSFTYRLLMQQRGVELEMRNRCSAGQRMLASIVIRLALAEALSVNCGILALDEPTTNLDRENAESLSRSLAQLISQKQSISGFQLVLITHDQHFLSQLLPYVDQVHVVEKSPAGFSTINCVNKQDL